MMGLEIFLLRHGESEGNREKSFGGHGPTPLTPLGLKQAEDAARALTREAVIDAIYASDLPRARQTAAPLARAARCGVVETAALRERSVGVFTGLTFAEAEARYPVHYAALLRRDPSVCPPEGETSHACRARAAALLDDAVLRHPQGRIVFVSHAHTISLLLRHLLRVDDDARVFFQTDNCAYHHVVRGKDGYWRVVALNERMHLR